MDNTIILYFVTVMIFSLMFAIGINHSIQQLTMLWRRPALLLRSLFAVVVLFPFVVFLLLRLFALPPTVATGLAVLAAAPGAPMMTKRTQMAGGDPTYAASLQLTLALLAVVITPLMLAVFYALFDLVTERVTPMNVALQVGEVTFLPVVIGLLIQRFAPGIARRIGKPVQTFANVLFLIFVLLLIALLVFAPDLRDKVQIGGPGMMAIAIIVAVSLVAGHILGGPSPEQRSVLAVGCIARNAGLALFIAGLSAYGQQFTPTILTYIIWGAVLAVPYSVWNKRRSKKAV